MKYAKFVLKLDWMPAVCVLLNKIDCFDRLTNSWLKKPGKMSNNFCHEALSQLFKMVIKSGENVTGNFF